MPHPVSNAIHYVVHNIRQANGLTATTPVGLTDERLELIVRGAVAAAETLAQEAADDARAENPLTPDQHARAAALSLAGQVFTTKPGDLHAPRVPELTPDASTALQALAVWVVTGGPAPAEDIDPASVVAEVDHARGERDDAVEVLREVYARALDKAMAQLPGKAPASAWEVVAEDIAKRANRRGITLTEDPA